MRILASAGVAVIFWTAIPCGGLFSVSTSIGTVMEMRREVTIVIRSGLIPATAMFEGVFTMARREGDLLPAGLELRQVEGNLEILRMEELKSLGVSHEHDLRLRGLGFLQNPFRRGVPVFDGNREIPPDRLSLVAENEPEGAGQHDGDHLFPLVFLQPSDHRPRFGEGRPPGEEGLQFDAEGRGVGDLLDTLSFCERDAAPLLGDHDADRVGPLRKTEGRRVAEAQTAVLGRVRREGQMAAEAHHPVAVDEDGAVVTDRMGIEDALQEGLAQDAVEVASPREVAVEGIVPLEDDQGADLLACKVGCGLGKDLRAFVECGDLEEPLPETSQQGQAFEETPEVLLKDDDEDEQQDRKEGLENDGGQIELEEAGKDIDDPEQGDARERRNGTPGP